MGRELFRANASAHTNPAFSSTLASSVSVGATSFSVATGDGAYLPSPTNGDFFRLRIGTNASNEVVRVTARSGDVLTCDALEAGHTAGDAVIWTVSGETLEALRLPEQSGNTGKVLQTNGSDISWAGIETGGLAITDFCTIKIGSAQSTVRSIELLLGFDTINTGDSSFLSVSDKGFKIPTGKAGYYRITGKYTHILGSGLSNMTDLTMYCKKNGTIIAETDIGFAASAYTGKTMVVDVPLVYLAENDIITFTTSTYSLTNDTDSISLDVNLSLASLVRYNYTTTEFSLPTQTNNSGKALFTNGNNSYWSAIPTGGMVISDFCILNLGSNQTVNHNSATTAQFNTVQSGDSSFYSSSDYGFKVPAGKAGYYRLFAQLSPLGSGNATNLLEYRTYLLVNGTVVKYGTQQKTQGTLSEISPIVEHFTYLNDGDVVTVQNYQYSISNSSQNILSTAANTYFELVRYEKSTVGNVTVEYDYVEQTSNTTITGTTEGTATTILTGNTINYDGNTKILVEFSCVNIQADGSSYLSICLFEGSTLIKTLAFIYPSASRPGSVSAKYKFTPTAGNHTYSIKGIKGGTGTVIVYGASSNNVPATMSITNANSTVSIPYAKTTSPGILQVGIAQTLVGGRLTLESGNPVSTTDQTTKSTLYYTPYNHNIVGLYDGTSWIPVEFSEVSLSLTGLTSGKPFDVFGYINSGSLALESLVWTNDTTRATALSRQNGVLVKNGDATRRYLGSFYTTGTGTTEDSLSNRFVYNEYNRVDRQLYKSDTAKATYSGNAWRAWAGNEAGYKVSLFYGGMATLNTALTFYAAVPSGVVNAGFVLDAASTTVSGSAYENLGIGRVNYNHSLSTGLHYFIPVEYNVSGGNTGTLVFAVGLTF